MLWLALEPMVVKHPQKHCSWLPAPHFPACRNLLPVVCLAEKQPPIRESLPNQICLNGKELSSSRHPSSPLMGLESEESFVSIAFGTKLQPVHIRSKRGVPSVLSRKLKIEDDMKTILRATVSHHPHGDWELRVRVNGKIISRKEVSSKTVTNEWLTHEVDLSPYAGKEINLQLENQPTDWRNEWGYWHEVKVSAVPFVSLKPTKVSQKKKVFLFQVSPVTAA